MKPLFQFATVAPSAEVIWNTLSDHDITTVTGYTINDIRFYMFLILKLHNDFKVAKELCNNYMARIHELPITTRSLLSIPTEKIITGLQIPPADLPQWTKPELYIPYYMLKQLFIPHTSEVWYTLFNIEYPNSHAYSIMVDNEPISEYITAYKLWYYGNDIITEKYSDIFEIVNIDSYIPITIHNSIELITELIKYMYDELIDSDSNIYDYSHKISIPPFILGDLDASQ
jgi:hypothetical protein